ncbi:hypothetical protein PILCRDRAFT_824286 [Piloderma croceum F 1598]|uniref:Zinc-finger domain-containing protein n=1 Tax=Piloderma croceum (strain F 1598) TaxID=765440 RepID=A0A0C3FFA7_PILCF|nr:hypothetical protein PILCRDRAFT_824286 [Piloderma croceum F 1598]
MYTSTLANWDGSLSGSATEQAQPVQGSSTSNSASTVSATTPYLSSTSSSVATPSTNFKSPSRSENGRRQAENDDLGAITPLGRKQQLISNPYSTDPATNRLMTFQRLVSPTTASKSSSSPNFNGLYAQTTVEKQDDADEMAVDAMLENVSPRPSVPQPRVRVPPSSLRQSPSPSPPSRPNEPLFTPPLLDELFTPPPTSSNQIFVSHQKSRPRPKPRFLLDFVEVPFMTGSVKAKYEDGGESGKNRLDHKARAEDIPRNPIFEALSAGLRHNGAHMQTYMPNKLKGKARARFPITDSDEEDFEEDYGTIFVSRPLKRKEKGHETDEDDRSYGSPPRKKKYIRRPKAVDSASASPVPQSSASAKGKAKAGPQTEAKRKTCDFLLLDVSDVNDPPPGLLPTTHATLSSIRHLRRVHGIDHEREKLWESRFDAGEEYSEAYHVVHLSSAGKKKIKAKSRVARPAGVKSSATGSGRISSGLNGFRMDDSRQHHLDASISAFSPVTKGKGRPRIQALGSLSPSVPPGFTLEREHADAMAEMNPPSSDSLMNIEPREIDATSTDADAEGEVDMDYFLNDLENHSDIAVTGNVPSDVVADDKDKEEESAGLISIPTTLSSTHADPISSLDIYSSEGHIHADHPDPSAMNSEDTIQPQADPFISGQDQAVNDDDALYSTSNDYTNSPWISGGEGDFQNHSPIDAMTESSINGTWNGTIDPSLLGGGERESQPLTPSPSPPPIRGAFFNAEASSSHLPVKSHTSFDNALPPRRHSSQRVPRPRHLDNYVDVDDLDLSADSDSEASFLGVSKRSDHVSDSTYDSDASDTVSKPTRATLAVHIPGGSTSNTASRDTSEVAPVSRGPAPKLVAPKKGKKPQKITKHTPGVTWCHQCRRNTFHDKMKCTNLRPEGDLCTQRFCIICVEKRYPNISFDPQTQDFICPKCTNTCNCTVCTAKRGEKYVSSSNRGRGRGRGRGGSTIRPRRGRTTKDHSANLLQPQNAKPHRIYELPQNATKYWGTIYGTSGEKIGTAFVGEDDDASIVVPRLMRAAAPKLQQGKRVFIGQVQDIWDLRDYTVRNVVNDSNARNGVGKGKGKAGESDQSSIRMYIGKKPPRSTEPIPAEGGTIFRASPSIVHDSEMSDLTPPSSPKDWPEPAVGESAHFGYDAMPTVAPKQAVDTVDLSPELGLSPGKMEMAIALGLGALQFPN